MYLHYWDYQYLNKILGVKEKPSVETEEEKDDESN